MRNKTFNRNWILARNFFFFELALTTSSTRLKSIDEFYILSSHTNIFQLKLQARETSFRKLSKKQLGMFVERKKVVKMINWMKSNFGNRRCQRIAWTLKIGIHEKGKISFQISLFSHRQPFALVDKNLCKTYVSVRCNPSQHSTERFPRFTISFRNCEQFSRGERSFFLGWFWIPRERNENDNELMSYIIYYAFWGDLCVTDFWISQNRKRSIEECTCLCSYVILFIIMLLNEAQSKEIAKCSWQRKLNKQQTIGGKFSNFSWI